MNQSKHQLAMQKKSDPDFTVEAAVGLAAVKESYCPLAVDRGPVFTLSS